MKKIVSIIIAVIMLATTASAATIPSFLTDIVPNYSADYSVSVTFDSSDEISVLLDEVEFSEQLENFVDIKALLKTLLAYEGKMKLQVNMSKDYKVVQVALTSESAHKIDVNPNLNVGINSKTGLWLNMDLTDIENPVFDIIYSLPFLNKYLKISADDLGAEMPFEQLEAIFNKEYMETMQQLGAELYAKHAEFIGGGNKYTITMDNDGLTAYIDELMSLIPQMTPMADESIQNFEIPSVKGWRLLGENGIKCMYQLKGGKITNGSINADISIDIAEIYTALTGTPWIYEAEGLLDFTVKIDTDVYAVNATKVIFPELTEENTISIADMGGQYTTDIPADTGNIYPNWYVREYCDQIFEMNGEVYVPLRRTMEAAYEDSISISYNNGVVSMSSEFFPDFQIAEVIIGTPAGFAGGAEYEIGAPVIIDDKTYVGESFFREVLGWELSSAQYDIRDKSYSYSFYTTSY